MEPLPFDLDKYFNRPPGTTEIDLALLVPNRARMAGIQKAWELIPSWMWTGGEFNASRGSGPEELDKHRQSTGGT